MNRAPTPRMNEACMGCGLLELCIDSLERRRAKSDEQALWRQMRGVSALSRRALTEQIAVHRDSQTAQDDAFAVISLEAGTKYCQGVVAGANVVGLHRESNCGNNLGDQLQMISPLFEELNSDPRFQDVRERMRRRSTNEGN